MTRAGRPRAVDLPAPSPNGELPPSAWAIAEPRLRVAVGSDGFVHDYLAYARELTDAPDEFHVGAALMALATAAGNRIYLEQWGQRIFLTLWLILVSPSGWFRKSTVLNMLMRLLVDAGLADALLPAQWSRESLLDVLTVRPAGTLHYGEFGAFLAMLGRDYMMGAKEDLTELFDSPPLYERRLRSTGSGKIQYPALNLMAGTVIDWLTGRLRDGDVRGGFLARFLFITATEKTRWMGLTREMDVAKKNVLVAHLAHISTMTGAVDLDAIRAPYEAWLHDHEHREPIPDLMGSYARLGTYAIKLAALFSLAAPTPSLTLTEESWARAEALIEYLREQIVWMITDQVTASPYEAKRLKVLTAIRKRPGLPTNDLLRTVKLPSRELDDILRTLDLEDSIVSIKGESGPQGGRPLTRYYPKEAKRS